MGYILVIALFAGILMFVDACAAAYAASKGGGELKGIHGFRRCIIALTVILILGIAIFHLLAYPPDDETRAIINNVLSILAGLVAAIAGFYFGGRFTEKRAEGAEKKAKEASERGRNSSR